MGIDKVPGELITDVRVHSTIAIIKAAALRRKWAAKAPIKFPRRPLDELFALYHTHEASDPRDKVYALLSLSTNTYPLTVADYHFPWHDLFEDAIPLTRFTKDDKVNVPSSSEHQVVLIRGAAFEVKVVSAVQYDTGWSDRPEVQL